MENLTTEITCSDINNSGDSDDRYELWNTYRTELKNIINKAISTLSQFEEIIILGAGKCNDIDLNFLIQKFKKIILTDVDYNSILDGVKRQGLTEEINKKIYIEKADYLGLDEKNFFDKLFKRTNKNEDIYKLEKFISKSINNVNPDQILDKHKGKYSIVVSSSVYSQLLYNHIDIMLAALKEAKKNKVSIKYTEKQLSYIDKSVRSNMHIVLRKYNQLLKSLLTKNGILILWTDIIELNANSDLHREIMKIIRTGDNSDNELESIINEKGLLLPKIALEDITNKLQVANTYWLEWPFNEKKHYLVKVIIGK